MSKLVEQEYPKYSRGLNALYNLNTKKLILSNRALRAAVGVWLTTAGMQHLSLQRQAVLNATSNHASNIKTILLQEHEPSKNYKRATLQTLDGYQLIFLNSKI